MKTQSFLFSILGVLFIVGSAVPRVYAAAPQGSQGTSIWLGEPSTDGEFKVQFRFQHRNRFNNEVTFTTRTVAIQVTKETTDTAKAEAFKAAFDAQVATLPENVRSSIETGRTGANVTASTAGSDPKVLSDIEADIVNDGTSQAAHVYNRPDPRPVLAPGTPGQLGVAPYDIGVRFSLHGEPSGSPSKGGPEAFIKFGVDAFEHTVHYGPGRTAVEIAHELAEAFRSDQLYVMEDGPSFLIVFPNGEPFVNFVTDDSDTTMGIGWQIVTTR